jgi:hypothetical protein
LWSASGGFQLVSQVATNGKGHLMDSIEGLKKQKRPTLIEGEYGAFYVGAGAHEHGRPVNNLSFERLTGSPEMRALFYAALAQYQNEYGPFDDALALMVGLPLQMMTGDTAKDYQKGVRAWLTGTHEFEADGITHRIEIESVKQTSQPVGALFDYVLDHRGKIIDQEHGAALMNEVGVISVGFNTVELMVVKEQRAFQRFTKGNTLGVRRLLELMNPNGLRSLAEMDELVRAGGLKAELKAALPIWASEINGEIEDVWEGGKHQRFEKILVVGGGPLLLRERLTAQFGLKAWMPDNPVMSIARGLQEMLLMMENRGK